MTTQNGSLRWGIIGPGRIARRVADAIGRCESNRLVAVASRRPDHKELAAHFPRARVHTGYDAILEDEEVDVVYIATPHPFHAEWSIRAADAGKHVLCEKPVGMCRREAEGMFAAARRNGTFMGEAFMYRLHPQTQKLIEVLRSGVIGDIAFIKSSFAFAVPRDEANRRLFDVDLGGGGILDLGVYPVSMARLIAGVANGTAFSEPLATKGVACIGETGVDERASAILSFPGNILAELSCAISLQLDNRLRIFGSRGRLEIQDFWFCGGLDGGTARIDLIALDGDSRSISVDSGDRGLYDFEIDATAHAIAAGQQQFAAPGMSWDDSLGNMQVIDEWRAAIGH